LSVANSSPLARLFSYARRVPLGYVAGGTLTLLYAASAPFVPLVTGRVVDALRSRPSPIAAVQPLILELVLVASGVALVRVFSRIVMFSSARQIEYQLRNDLLLHLQKLPQSYFGANRTGDLMSRAVNDLNSIRLFLGMGLMNLVQTPVLYLAAFSGMLALDPLLTVSVVAPYLLFVGIIRFFARRMQPASLAVQQQLGELSTVAQENAAGVFVVRTYGMEPSERDRFRAQSQELYRRHIRFGWVSLSMQPTIAIMPALAAVSLLAVGGMRVQSGQLTLGSFTAFHFYLLMLTPPTVMLGFTFVLAQRGLASLSRLGEVLDVVPAIRERDDVLDVRSLRGNVRVSGLSFGYGGGRSPALEGVDFEALAGQTIGIVGPVGAGKSTLVNAIPRLIEFGDGCVSIDGVDVNQIPLRVLRSSIAMVPQDSFLFSASVAENIAFGCPDASIDEIRAAAARAYVLEDIEDLPQGFDTQVGERGITLSGGQRQRIALARALILDPAILILDDALSSVDAVTEEAILKNLRSARAGRTCFIVAHRLSAVRDADQTVVLEAGRVAEVGSHEELLKADGVYARTFRQQRLEAEIGSEELL